MAPQSLPPSFTYDVVFELGRNFNFPRTHQSRKRHTKSNKVSELSPICPLIGSEMAVCFAHDHSSSSKPWSGVCEKRRHLSNPTVEAHVAADGGHRSLAQLLQRTIKQEPSTENEPEVPVMGSAPHTQESDEHDAAGLLVCLRSHFECSSQLQQGHRYQLHPAMKQLRPQQQQRAATCGADLQAGHLRREAYHLNPRPSGMPPVAPSLPPPCGPNDEHTQFDQQASAASTRGGGTTMAWRSGAVTVTTGVGTGSGTAAGPGFITTGVRVSACSPAVVSGVPGNGPSSVTRAAVVTGCRPRPQLKRKRSAVGMSSSATLLCPSQPSAVTTAVSLPSSPSASSFAAGGEAAASRSTIAPPTLATPTAIPVSPLMAMAMVLPGPALHANVTHGSLFLSTHRTKRGSGEASMGSGDHFKAEKVLAIEEDSAPSTPPRSPEGRLMPQVPVQPAGGSQVVSNRLGDPIAPALQLLGFQMTGMDLCTHPHACVAASTGPAGCAPKGQIVHIVLRLSPLTYNVLQTPHSENPDLGTVEQASSGSTISNIEIQPESSEATARSLYAARECSVPSEIGERRHGMDVRTTEVEQQQPQLQQFVPATASVLVGENGMSRSTTSLEEQLPSAALSSRGWLPANIASDPALTGLERLLSAAAAAATAAAAAATATDGAELYTSPGYPPLPALLVPRPDPGVYFEPDSTLRKGDVLQTACNIIRLAKMLRGEGVSVGLPWCDLDDGTSSATSRASGAGAAAFGSGGGGLLGKLGAGPLGMPQSATAAVAASGRRTVPLAIVLKTLSDFCSAARALQQAEAWSAAAVAASAPSSSSSAAPAQMPVAVTEDYKALWPLMAQGRKCAEAVMARVERTLTGDVAGPSPQSSKDSIKSV